MRMGKCVKFEVWEVAWRAVWETMDDDTWGVVGLEVLLPVRAVVDDEMKVVVWDATKEACSENG